MQTLFDSWTLEEKLNHTAGTGVRPTYPFQLTLVEPHLPWYKRLVSWIGCGTYPVDRNFQPATESITDVYDFNDNEGNPIFKKAFSSCIFGGSLFEACVGLTLKQFARTGVVIDLFPLAHRTEKEHKRLVRHGQSDIITTVWKFKHLEQLYRKALRIYNTGKQETEKLEYDDYVQGVISLILAEVPHVKVRDCMSLFRIQKNHRFLRKLICAHVVSKILAFESGFPVVCAPQRGAPTEHSRTSLGRGSVCNCVFQVFVSFGKAGTALVNRVMQRKTSRQTLHSLLRSVTFMYHPHPEPILCFWFQATWLLVSVFLFDRFTNCNSLLCCDLKYCFWPWPTHAQPILPPCPY